MKASILLPAYNKGNILEQVLDSIFCQKPNFEFEVIVIDDGSSDNTKDICAKYPLKYFYLNRPYYTNPAQARNIGYLKCEGKIVITQSAEIIHKNINNIQLLVDTLEQNNNSIVFGKVDLVDKNGKFIAEYCGSKEKRKLFFLGAVYLQDIFDIRGDSEDFIEPGSEDAWFTTCLMKGLGRKAVFNDNILGWHIEHSRPSNTDHHTSRDILRIKQTEAEKNPKKYIGSLGKYL